MENEKYITSRSCIVESGKGLPLRLVRKSCSPRWVADYWWIILALKSEEILWGIPEMAISWLKHDLITAICETAV
jgi:hypothetical protein